MWYLNIQGICFWIRRVTEYQNTMGRDWYDGRTVYNAIPRLSRGHVGFKLSNTAKRRQSLKHNLEPEDMISVCIIAKFLRICPYRQITNRFEVLHLDHIEPAVLICCHHLIVRQTGELRDWKAWKGDNVHELWPACMNFHSIRIGHACGLLMKKKKGDWDNSPCWRKRMVRLKRNHCRLENQSNLLRGSRWSQLREPDKSEYWVLDLGWSQLRL